MAGVRLIIFAFAGACAAFAQEAASISGVVTDGTEAIIPNATVIARRDGSIESLCNKTTDEDGRFTCSSLPAGIYSLEIAASGFQTRKLEPVEVKGNEAKVLPHLRLQVKPSYFDCPDSFNIPTWNVGSTRQSQPSVTGTVFFIPPKVSKGGANVTLKPLASGHPIASVATESDGHFHFDGLTPGAYQLTVHEEGYADFIIDSVELSPLAATEIIDPLPLQRCTRKIKCIPTKVVRTHVICL